jgi:hypothetical protein
MGPIAFRFYVPTAIAYLLSEEASDDADAVRSFRSLVELRLDHAPSEIAPVASTIRAGMLGILERFDRYECQRPDNLARRYRVLVSRLERLTPATREPN